MVHSRENVMPVCRLCGCEKERLCKAHVLPEAFFRAIRLDGEPLMSIPGSEKYPYTQTWTGRWDAEILCSDCDGRILGKLDDYAARIFLQREFSVHWIQERETTSFRMKEVDVSRIKLFWVSVLWRHAITSLPEHQDIQLAPDDLEVIRQMILREDCGTPHEFSVVMIYFGNPQVIVGMSESEFGAGWFETFINGWHVFMKGHRTEEPHFVEPLFLKAAEDPIVIVRDIDDVPGFWKMITKFVRADKAESNQAYANYQRRVRQQSTAGS